MMNMKRRLLLRIEGCPFCIRAEEALDAANIVYEKIEVDRRDRSIVQILSGQPTVPVLVEVIGCDNQDDDIIAYIETLTKPA
jgi:glutaredoxin